MTPGRERQLIQHGKCPQCRQKMPVLDLINEDSEPEVVVASCAPCVTQYVSSRMWDDAFRSAHALIFAWLAEMGRGMSREAIAARYGATFLEDWQKLSAPPGLPSLSVPPRRFGP